MDQSTFKCSCCGEILEGPPLSWHFEAPDAWNDLSPADRKIHGQLSSDQCIIGRDYFIRGLVEIPIIDNPEVFAWGVWVSLSEENFACASELWDDDNRVNEPPYFGWLCNSLPGYPETLNLKTMVHTRTVGQRPYVERELTEHPLAIEQRKGIPMARVQQIAEAMYHGSL